MMFLCSIYSLGIIGVTSGIAATVGALAPTHDVLAQMGMTMGIGGTLGAIVANRVAITDLPQLVAAFHSFVGLAAVLTSISSFLVDASKSVSVRYQIEKPITRKY